MNKYDLSTPEGVLSAAIEMELGISTWRERDGVISVEDIDTMTPEVMEIAEYIADCVSRSKAMDAFKAKYNDPVDYEKRIFENERIRELVDAHIPVQHDDGYNQAFIELREAIENE